MADTLLDDVSHWQGDISWVTHRGATPYLLASIMKCTQGDSTSPYRRDGKFGINKQSCVQMQIPWGAYHFFEPKYSSEDQAQWFINNVGSGCNVYVADIETNIGASSNSDMMKRVKSFVETVRDLTGLKPLIYTSYGLWNTWCGTEYEWWAEYPLWVAHYTTATSPRLPKGWKSWKIWQYTSKGDGKKYGVESLGLDMNRFNGTPVQLVSFFGNGSLPTTIPPEPPTVPEFVTINTSVLNIRKGPGVEYADIGDTFRGNVWEVEDSELDTDGKIWYRVGKSVYLAGWLVTPSGNLASNRTIGSAQVMSVRRVYCDHCGSKFTEDSRGNCSSCGAPNRA